VRACTASARDVIPGSSVLSMIEPKRQDETGRSGPDDEHVGFSVGG
jgi:hypothetical protein